MTIQISFKMNIYIYMKIQLAQNFYFRIDENATKNQIIQDFNTSFDNIKRNNQELNLYEGEWVKVKINDYILHFVKPAETLDKICLDYNISQEKIISDNKLSSRKLYIGQQLKIYKS